ncbi:MAG: tetratricopeptide repeat protein [Candidatus Aminicenantes bacterium]|nr:tetratricopeptide repeat protein [Candidatus Aminicenantes bacterium]
MLQRAVEANPDFPLAYFYLARNHLNRGTNYEEALALAKKGLELRPNPADLPLGYFLMADLYNRLGDERQSREFARKGQEAAAALPPRR